MESVKALKVTTLADNLTLHGSLLGQWGLSLLLEVTDLNDKKHVLLLDTGAVKDALLFNIDRLKINLAPLEVIAISHGHGDHTAATVEIARRSKQKVQVIAHPYAFKKRFTLTKDGRRRPSQIPKGEREKDIEATGAKLMLTREPYQIIPGVTTTGEIPRVTKFEKVTGRRYIVIKGKPERDRILDDQALIVNVRGQGAWILTGCAHSGIINTLKRFEEIAPSLPVHAIIGGFHLVSKKRDEIKPVVDALKPYRPRLISPCHCTGLLATRMIWEAFEKQFVLNFSGRTFTSEKRTRPQVL